MDRKSEVQKAADHVLRLLKSQPATVGQIVNRCPQNRIIVNKAIDQLIEQRQITRQSGPFPRKLAIGGGVTK